MASKDADAKLSYPNNLTKKVLLGISHAVAFSRDFWHLALMLPVMTANATRKASLGTSSICQEAEVNKISPSSRNLINKDFFSA